MTEGPPPSEATSSKASVTHSGNFISPTSTAVTTGLYQPYLHTNPYAAHYLPHSYYSQYQSQPTTYISQPIQPATHNSSFTPPSNLKPTRKQPSPPPSPPPPDPETYKHWDVVIRAFFLETGLTQALKGFEADMLVLNPEWEQLKIPQALEEMIKGLNAILGRGKPQTVAENRETREAPMQIDGSSQSPLETRKLGYVHLANGTQPRSQSSINKSISLFLAQNQARNDASNRAEFLSSLTERRKRQRVDETEGSDPSHATSNEPSGSCARVDAKTIDRDAQMMYDIAKDDWGPLSRSAKAGLSGEKGKAKSSPVESEITETQTTGTTTTIKKETNEEGLPGLDERLKNIEDHIAVRFVPTPPRTLLARLKFLEDHLIKLEKEYPPWAALHFNQPGRGWPPPPRTTPIIVPLHLRDTTSDPTLNESTTTPIDTAASKTKSKVKSNGKVKSSLHRAVMEKLEVQRAMRD